MNEDRTTADPLNDFAAQTMTFLSRSKRVYVAGDGPAVIVMHELPGITPAVARFARAVRDAGFRVYMPVLTGVPGKRFSPGYMLREAAKVCVSREFFLFNSADRASPVVEWLKALAAFAHGECGGRGVGAIGMCLTGNFALSMLLEPAVRAGVLCQPSMPANDPAGLHIAPDDLSAVKARLDAEDLTVLAYRFAGDRLCPAARFLALEAALGDRVKTTTIADEHARQGTGIPPHSVVTTHLIDEAGQPTRQARDEILAFFGALLR